MLVVCSALLFAKSREFAMPALVPASAMSCHDAHAQEKAAFGADPYDMAQKASIFRVDMAGHSVLPVLVVFTNDGDEPLTLGNARFELITRDRAKAQPYSMDDLRRALTALQAPNSRTQDKIPVPLPGKGNAHGGVSNREMQELERAFFMATKVEPHSSEQGFLFFDVTGLEHPAQGARLYLTGVSDRKGNELMYFEVPLDREAGQP